MKYELKTYRLDTAPIFNPDTKKLDCNCIITSGIVGDTYGFNKFDRNVFQVDAGLTVEEVAAELVTLCTAWVAETYPNT
jgi:hypothetical protein